MSAHQFTVVEVVTTSRAEQRGNGELPRQRPKHRI